MTRSRRGYSLLELTVGLILAAMLTAVVGFAANSVLSKARTRSTMATLQAVTVEVERVRQQNGGSVPQSFAASMRIVSGLSATDGVSTGSTVVSVASDGEATVALALRDGDACSILLYSDGVSTFARDAQNASCSAVAALGATVSITGTAAAPATVDLG